MRVASGPPTWSTLPGDLAPPTPEGDRDACTAPAPRIAGNAIWRLASTLARFALSFVGVPLLTRALGMEQWGLLALLQAVTAPLAVLEIGLSASTVKNVSEALGRGDRDAAVRTLHSVAISNTLLGGAFALAVGLAAPWLAGALFAIPSEQVPQAVSGMRIVGLQAWSVFASGTWIAVHTALQRYDRHAMIGLGIAATSTAAGVLSAMASGDVVAVVLAQAVVSALGTAAWWASATSLLPTARGLPRWDTASFRKAARLGGMTMIAAVSTIVSGWIDRYTLGAHYAPAVVGFYAIAHMLQAQAYGMFGDMGEVLFPAVSHRQGQGDLPGARRLTLLAGWSMTMGFGILATSLAVIGGDFIALWVSPEASASATFVLRLLCVGGAIGMAAVAPLHYFLGSGLVRPYAIATVATAGIIALASLVLIPRLGLQGAGLGLLAGVLVRLAIVALAWRSAAAPREPAQDFAVHLLPAPVIAVASILLLAPLHDRVLHEPSWPLLGAEALVVTGVAGALQLLAGSLLPGGRRRLAEVAASFRPVVERLLGRGAR